jgi:hypothetical protein
LHKLSKIEDGIVRAGHDLQLLSRFIGAQRLAFGKILKKHRKWCKSSKLSQRFKKDRLDSSEFLGQKVNHLDPLLSRYTALLEAVRAPFEIKDERAPENSVSNQVISILQKAFEADSDTKTDAAFFSMPPTVHGGSATYWIHNDNILQIQVLMQSYFAPKTSACESPASPTNVSNGPFGTFDDVYRNTGLVVCDKEDFHPEAGTRVAGSMHYTASDKKVSLVLSTQPVTLKKKEIADLFKQNRSVSNTTDFDIAKTWFHSNKAFEPLVDISYSRTRYLGLSNSKSAGIWATFDSDIIFAKPASTDTHTFPHAILEIRWEAQSVPELVKKLDDSAIAQRIPDFRIEIHAIAKLYGSIPDPLWFLTLKTEIRKVPTAELSPDKTSSNGSDARKSISLGSVTDGPFSVFSNSHDQTSATSVPESSRIAENIVKSKRERARNLALQIDQPYKKPAPARYWNEFDDEPGAEEPYSVLVYPEEDIVCAMFSAFGQSWNKMMKNIKPAASQERQSLLGSEASMATSSSENTVKPKKQNILKRYSTFANQQIPQPKTPAHARILAFRDRALFHATWSVFTISILFFIMSVVIEATGRRRYITETNVFSILGIVMSIFLATLGLFFGHLRNKTLDWIGRAIIVVLFVVICTANGGLILVIVM